MKTRISAYFELDHRLREAIGREALRSRPSLFRLLRLKALRLRLRARLRRHLPRRAYHF